MKVTVKPSDLSRVLKMCVAATDPKDQLRSNIEFRAEGNVLTLMATNTSYSIEAECQAQVEEEGCAIVDGEMSYTVISKAVGNDCVISADGPTMIIKTNGRTKLPNIQRHVPMIDRSEGRKVTCDSIAFKNAISKVSYATSENNTRIVLTGANIVSDGETLTITSCDGFRVAQKRIPCFGENISIIVPTRILNAICGAVSSGELTIISDANKITVIGEGFEINATTLLGDYIDTSRIFPVSYKTVALVTTSELKNALDSSVVGSGVSNIIRLNVSKGDDGDSILLSANSAEADYSGTCLANVQGDDIRISFNLKYLIQAISKIDTEQLEIKFNSEVTPAVIFPRADDANEIHLVLPVRVF